MILWWILLLSSRAVEAELVTVGGTGGDSQRFETSTFRYYGRPAHDQSIYDAQAVFLSGSEICNPIESRVRGKLVFSDMLGQECRINHVYRTLSNAGALGFVVILFFFETPGFYSYLHQAWDRNKYANRQMLMVTLK